MIITLAYTVDFENLEVGQAPTAALAEAHVAALPEDRTAFVFDTDRPDWLGDQLYDRYSCAQLPQLFNAVRDPSVPPVNKFEDKPTALRRLAAQLVIRARAASPLAPSQPRKDQPMPRPRGALGAFKPMRKDSRLARIVSTVLATPGVTVEALSDHLAISADAVRLALAAGRRSHGVDSSIDEDGSVSVILPDGVDPFVTPAEKPTRTPRSAPKVGAFSPIRRRSPIGDVVAAALGAHQTLDQIAVSANLTPDQALAALKRGRANNGIAFAIDPDTSVVSLTLPVPANELFRAPKPKPERISTSGERRTAYLTKEMAEAAKAGTIPPRITVTSQANLHRQKHFDKLADLAEAGDWDEIRAYHMKGTDTYCKMIHKYRDMIIAAHEAA